MDLYLYTREECPLCDRLHAMLGPRLKNLKIRYIDANAHWYETYRYRIPVLTQGEQVLLEGKPDLAEVDRVIVSLKS